MVEPRELLAVARHLILGDQPSDAALRRSVSTAYYALFHALAGFAADRLVASKPSAAHALVYRALDHKRLRDALEDVAKPNLRIALRRALGRSAVSPEMKAFADVFVPMQQLRHVADYDPTITLSKTDARDAIDEADRALTVLSSISEAELIDLVTYVLIGSRSS